MATPSSLAVRARAAKAFEQSYIEGGAFAEDLLEEAKAEQRAGRHDSAAAICLAVMRAWRTTSAEEQLARVGWAIAALEQIERSLGHLADETIAEPLFDLWIEALTSGFFWIATCASRCLRSLDDSWQPLRARRCERKLEALSDARDNDGCKELLWWLFTYHRARDDWEQAISYCIDLFELAPTEDIQSALLNAAERGGCLDQVRKDIAPVERAHLPDVPIKRALAANDVQTALDLWAENPDHPRLIHCAEGLAEAMYDEHPEVALTVYLDLVDHLISKGGRKNYTEACHFLATTQKLLAALGELAQWKLVIDDLAQRHCRKPALLDEMAKAGFVELSEDTREKLRPPVVPAPDRLPEDGVEE